MSQEPDVSTALHDAPTASTRETHEPTLASRVTERISEHRRLARGRQELRAALAGEHGPGVQAEVMAALER